MPHFFAKNLHSVALPAQSANFKFIFEAKSVRDKSAIILAESTHNGQKILLSKQEKDGKFLVKFNKHFASHSKEIIKFALKEYADLVGAEIVAHNLNENKIKVDSAYLLGWHDICALLGGNSPLDLHSADFANLGHCADFSPALHPKFAKNHESQTENPSVVDSARGAESSDKIQSKKPFKSFCYFWLLPKVESPLPLNPNLPNSVDSAIPQNLGGNSEKIVESALFCHSERSEESKNNPSLRANPQDLRGNPSCDSALFSSGGLPRSHSLARNDEFLDSSLRLRSAQNDNLRKNAESSQTTPQDAEFAFLEIGFGSGRHILHLAQKHPTARIIGLEIYRPAISQVLRQIELLNLQNLYLASIDARVLFEVLPARCLDRIFLHFPVPWDKNPQRRVLSEQFLSNAMRALKKGGIFELLTDSAEYFAFAKALARDYKCVAEEGAEGEVISKYEARWRRQEKVIYRLRVANSASCGDFSHLRSPRFLDELYVLSASLASHKCENSSTILEFASCVESVKNAESTLDSAESQNLGENISSLRDSAKQNRGKPPCNFNNYRLPRSHSLARNDEFIRDSSLRLRSAQNDKIKEIAELALDSAILSQGGLPRRFCESARNDNIFLDSSLRLRSAQNDNFGEKVAESRDSSLRLRSAQNDNVGLDSAKSQNLVKNNSVRSTKNSPASWCKKSESKGAEVPPADFLLEAEKRGSPPKSEKRQLLGKSFKNSWGERQGGAALLREETSEISGKRGAESIKESQSGLPREQSSLAMTDFGGLPRRFCESARNDEFIRDSSLRQCSAQNDKNSARVAESSLDSAPFSPKKICKKEYFLHIKNKYIFEGGAVVFASFGAYYAPSSAYFVLCGDEVSTISEIIPTRANIDAVGLFMELCFDN